MVGGIFIASLLLLGIFFILFIYIADVEFTLERAFLVGLMFAIVCIMGVLQYGDGQYDYMKGEIKIKERVERVYDDGEVVESDSTWVYDVRK